MALDAAIKPNTPVTVTKEPNVLTFFCCAGSVEQTQGNSNENPSERKRLRNFAAKGQYIVFFIEVILTASGCVLRAAPIDEIKGI